MYWLWRSVAAPLIIVGQIIVTAVRMATTAIMPLLHHPDPTVVTMGMDALGGNLTSLCGINEKVVTDQCGYLFIYRCLGNFIGAIRLLYHVFPTNV